jgi:hypothetical protein
MKFTSSSCSLTACLAPPSSEYSNFNLEPTTYIFEEEAHISTMVSCSANFEPEDGMISSSETSAHIHDSRRYIPDDGNLQSSRNKLILQVSIEFFRITILH